jgi:methionyl-tRNA formyltransferase
VNDDEGVTALRKLSPDVVLVFGTGKILPSVIEVAQVACLNLHGGNPEAYRGLDTHLWAIYHSDFDNLVTTLHHVDAQLDTGEIVFQSQLHLTKDSKLHELRSINTEVCIDISLLALTSLQSRGSLPSRKQIDMGRYYSFMPTVLKEICLKKFERHVAQL